MPPSSAVARTLGEAERHKSELTWIVELAGGGRAVLAQLAPELADDEALRRRYVFERDRIASRDLPRLCPTLETGPDEDAERSVAPWRLRTRPEGPTLEEVLRQRAPLPVDAAIELAVDLAGAVADAHRDGLVLRDLEPRSVIVDAADRRVWLADVGLARMHMLSTLTASSLMLESTAYAAPEHVRASVVDARADVYSLGVILYRALTGVLPFGGEHAFFRQSVLLAPVSRMIPECPPGLDELIAACLDEDPEKRPRNAGDLVRLLTGEARAPLALARVACQSCGASMRPGLRLCLRCGRQAVQFLHAGDGKLYSIFLTQAREEASFFARLREVLEELSDDGGPLPEFLIGDPRMYSKDERAGRVKLPALLFKSLNRRTADVLAERLRARGLKVKVRKQPREKKRYGKELVFGGVATGVLSLGALFATATPWFFLGFLGAVGMIIVGGTLRTLDQRAALPALRTLRDAPAALPASDPLVARLAALLSNDLAGDVHERLSELALLVQRLVDQRASRVDDPDLETLLAPVSLLVTEVERTVESLARLDAALANLDESALVRAIAASEARREPADRRAEFLEALDRLRSLEERRVGAFAALLEATQLLSRISDLSLEIPDHEREEEALRQQALALLRGGRA